MHARETKTYRVTAPPHVLRRFEAFMAFLHYNAGHSGTFAMCFDGDGDDRFTVEPPPPVEFRHGAQQISDAGLDIEVAGESGLFRALPVAVDQRRYVYRHRRLYRVGPDGSETMCKEYGAPDSSEG